MALAKDLVRIGMTAKEAHFLGETTEDEIAATSGSGYPITATINRVTFSASGFAVLLPLVEQFPNSRIVIRNDSIWPISVNITSGNLFSNGASAYLLNTNSTSVFYKLSNTLWMVDL